MSHNRPHIKAALAAAACAALCLALYAVLPYAALAGGVSWAKYEDGLSEAKSSSKPVLLDFSTSWCGNCREMDRNVFSDPKVISALTGSVVAVKVDGDERTDLKSKYRVFAYPTFFLLDENGEVIAQKFGSMDKKEFLEFLGYASSGAYKEVSYQKYESSNK